MGKIYLLIILNFILTLHACAQFETDYKPIVSGGVLPKDFVTLSSQKYEEAKRQLSSRQKDQSRKDKESFLLETNFAIDDILLSGKVLFNDPLSEYLGKVADKVLVSDPELRGQLRFYVYKSTVVNAFSTHQGIVLVTAGLLAQVHNEAELAFVLCHEAIHFKEKHAINEYLEEEKIKKGKGAYKELAKEEKLVARCAYSKEEEKEADEKGLELFLKSQYSSAHLIGVYDVLKYSYLPFADVTFDKAFFEGSFMEFPNKFYKAQTLAIDTANIEDDDPRSTHPSILSRREKTLNGIKGADNTGKADYLVSEKDFVHVRELARFELCRLYTLYDDYEAGIYHDYLLLKKYPDNIYLKKNIAFCLGGLAQYSNSRRFKEVHSNSDSIEGKSQALNYLMYCLDSMEQGAINIVAMAYATKLKAEYPNDEDLKELYRNLMYSLVKTYDFKLKDFNPRPYERSTDVAASAGLQGFDSVKNETEKRKFETLNESASTSFKRQAGKPIFIKYAFTDYIDKDWFKKDFVTMEDSVELDGKKVTAVIYEDDYRMRSRWADWDDKVYALGIDTIVVVDPEYARVNARKKEKYKYIESEGGQVDFAERLRLNAKKAKLTAVVLNTKNLNADEVEKLDDIALMSDYMEERLSHNNDVNMPYFERTRIKDLANKYGSRYFMWTGAMALTDKNSSGLVWAIYTSIFPVLLPFTIPALINGGQYTIYYTLVYDVTTDKVKLSNYREVKARSRGYILNSQIYDVLNQIKSKPRKK